MSQWLHPCWNADLYTIEGSITRNCKRLIVPWKPPAIIYAFSLLAVILRDFICDHERVDKTRICLTRKYNYTILACHCFLRRNKQSQQIRADMFWYFGKSHYVQPATAGTVSEARWRRFEFVGTSPVLLMRISFLVLLSTVLSSVAPEGAFQS